jgi:hypothetical protein
MAFDQNEPQEDRHIQQARAYLQQNQPGEAVQAIRRYLSYAPGRAIDYLLLGVAEAQAGAGLQAIAALEHAASMDPRDPTIAYNLGVLYRQAGRGHEALAAFERAVDLRPDYDAACRALEQMRQQIGDITHAPTAAGPVPVAGGAVRCPHCGMDSRSPISCEWCGHSMVTTLAAGEAGATAIAAVAMANAEDETLASGSLMQRVLRAGWAVIVDPIGAFNGGLDTFFNSPGAPGAVVACYTLSLIPPLIMLLLQPSTARVGNEMPKGAQVIFVLVSSFVAVLLTSSVIAFYNLVTGGSDGFLGDFGSLALSFAFISATIHLFCLPVTLPLQLTHANSILSPGVLVFIGQWFWVLVLEIMLVVAATDLSGFPAFILLLFANCVSCFGISSAVGYLQR